MAKPKPLDYTTIPGLKLNVSSAEEIPDLVQLPGSPIDPLIEGHLKIIEKYSCFREFLDFLSLTYGPLSSFWWSTRYVVVISNEKHFYELEKFCSNLLSISPFAIGSYLRGDEQICTNLRYGASQQKFQTKKNGESDTRLDEEFQDSILYMKEAKQCHENYESRQTLQYDFNKITKSELSRPLLLVFDEEIWVDAHPIPKFVPIVIHTAEIIRMWEDDELISKFSSRFRWVPGF